MLQSNLTNMPKTVITLVTISQNLIQIMYLKLHDLLFFF